METSGTQAVENHSFGKYMHRCKKRICKNLGVSSPALPINQRIFLSSMARPAIPALTTAAHASLNEFLSEPPDSLGWRLVPLGTVFA